MEKLLGNRWLYQNDKYLPKLYLIFNQTKIIDHIANNRNLIFQIRKMAEGRFSMEYESINERLSRLRKEAASPIRNK